MLNFTATRRAARKWGLALSASLLLGLALGGGPAAAFDSQLNDLIGGGDTGVSAGAGSRENAPQPPSGLEQQLPGFQTSPATPLAATGQPKGKAELWVAGKRPADHLQVIGAHPLPGESCRDVIFDARPTVKSRYDARKRQKISFEIDRLCLLGLRNDSEDRAMVVRVGQALESLAITPDPDLFSGKVLQPRQQVLIPIRPLPVGILDIPVELVWKSDIKKAKPQIDRVNVTVSKKSS